MLTATQKVETQVEIQPEIPTEEIVAPTMNFVSSPALHVQCDPAALEMILRSVKSTVAPRSTLPALKCVLLTAQSEQSDGAGQLLVETSKLDASSSAWLAARVSSPGSIAVPYETFSELVAHLPKNATVHLEVDASLQALRVRCDNIVINLNGISATEFPQPPEWKDGAQIELSGKELKGLMRQVVYAAAEDDSRPVLTGVLFELNPSGIAFAAADGFRLSLRAQAAATGSETTQSMIVPSKALRELVKIVADDVTVKLAFNANKTHLQFTMPNYRLITSLIEGNFPDYQKMVPTAHSTRAVVDARAFGAAVDLALIFARQAKNLVLLDVSPGANGTDGFIRITARSAENGDTVRTVSAAITGDAQSIGLNGKFVKEFVDSVGSPQLTLELNSPASAMLWGEIG